VRERDSGEEGWNEKLCVREEGERGRDGKINQEREGLLEER
jgi:hypothetical protein